jgi:hypothetical protein
MICHAGNRNLRKFKISEKQMEIFILTDAGQLDEPCCMDR